MEPLIASDHLNDIATSSRKKTRNRRPLPPQDARNWMTPSETALTLGCSVATVHRLRRGLILGVEPLPCSRYGRKFVFRKASIACWQDTNEQRGLA
jgi:Helix-turn-helix domain